MEGRNGTGHSEFLLRGVTDHLELWGLLFTIFLSMYLLTILGNLLIVLLIRSDARLLHAPMYFFLSYLSLADVGFISTITPKVLQNLLSETKTISHGGCFTQMYFYMLFGNTDSFLLASMAYDRYMAICHPLRYTSLMSHKCCLLLVAISWLIPCLHSLMYTLLMSRLSFCASRKIPHFFCDLNPMLGLSCSDKTLIETLMKTEAVVEILGPFVLIVVSYVLIFLAITKVPSAAGKRKAFYTCGSHLTVVILFYGNVSLVYFMPSSANPEMQDTVAGIMYTMVTPMLNPFIYSLKNSEIKAAMGKLPRLLLL
uniref:Olfactory receptor n=1 Tax=Sphenodon punctatus TaxID=8508 RepID=A0A8D0G2Q9_SPHPU